MKKKALMLMVIIIISKVVGFAREMILSFYYGASTISDAYIIALTIPTVIFAFVGAGISTTYIPIYSELINQQGFKRGNRFTSNVLNLIMLIATVFVIVVLVFTEPIVHIFASGFEGEALKLATTFTGISIFSIYFTGITYIFKSFLEVHGNFNIPALIGFPYNFIVIITIILSVKFKIELLAYGLVLAIASQLIILMPFIVKKGFNYQYIFEPRNEYIKKMFYLSLPVILGTSVNQINILVDRTLASRITIGGISALNYANRLNSFIHGIFVISIVTVMYPLISKMISENNIDAFKKYIIESISIINLLVIPSTVGAILFARPVVRLLFGRGQFDAQAIEMTSYSLTFYAIGMLAFGLRTVLARAFYAMQDTKTPMKNAAIGMVLNIILNLILSRILGLGGLALATSIAAMVTTILLFYDLRKRIGPFGMKRVTQSFMKIIFSSLVMGVVAKYTFDYFNQIMRQNFSLLLAVLIGSGLYFIIIYFMNIEEVDDVMETIRNRYIN